MERLPREIVLDILSRLPTPSLHNVKLVCRSWQNIVHDPVFIHLHFTRNNDNPCLILHGDHPIQNQLYSLFFYPHNNNVGMVKRLDATPIKPAEFEIDGSCNGLLCLRDLARNTIHLYNPFTNDCLELPKSSDQNTDHVWAVYGFGFLQERKEHKVLKFSQVRLNTAGDRICGWGPPSKVEILTVGSFTWRSLGEKYFHLIRSRSQVVVNGRFHWVNRPISYGPNCRLIVSFDLGDEKFRTISGPNQRYHHHQLQLLVIGGCLSVVVHNPNSGLFEIWIMKNYGVEDSWTKEFSICSHFPQELEQDVEPALKVSELFRRSFTRIICGLRNGDILLQHKCRTLISFDPKYGTFKVLAVPGMPNLFETVVQTGNFNGIEAIIGI